MLSKVVLIAAQIFTQVPGEPPGETSPERPPVVQGAGQEVAPRTEERTLGGIAAIVGNKVITRAELKKQLDRRINEVIVRLKVSPAEINRRREEKLLLEKMIEGELTLQAAMDLAFGKDIETVVSLELVMKFIDGEIANLQKTGYKRFSTRDDYFARHKSQFGNSREDVILKIREQIVRNDYLFRQVYPRIDRFISPAQSRAYYRSHREKFATPQAVEFQQIVFSADFNLNEKVRLVNEGLAAGQPFGDLAVKYSEVHQAKPRLRARSATVMYSDLDDYQHPIPQVLKALGKGQVSGPHRAKTGIYFFRMVDIVKGKPRSYGEAQEQIERILLNERHQIARRQDLKHLREDSHIETFLGDAVTSDSGKSPPGGSQKPRKTPAAGS